MDEWGMSLGPSRSEMKEYFRLMIIKGTEVQSIIYRYI